MSEDNRKLVFISHATPEDNAFTLWLSARLKILGYEVWSDVTQLFGGEKWWDDIEQAMDQFAAKFVLVITKTSLSKPGVQREVELAIAAEEKYKHTNFIIPIIIDDSKFGGQPYELSQRNIINFSTGWGQGFSRLVERLKRDIVPVGEVATDLGERLSRMCHMPLQIRQQDNLVLSNLLEIKSIPANLKFYRLPIDVARWKDVFDGAPWVWFEWGGMVATFAADDELKQYLSRYCVLSKAPVLDLKAVLEGQPRHHAAFLRGEVIKKVNFLLVEAWHAHMRTLGLHKYELSNGKVAWFFPNKEEFSGRLPFADVFGVRRNKQVMGYSAKNGVYWHYSIEPRAKYGPFPKLCLIPHVVFTEDGVNPLQDSARMHRLRRGFCRSWWNPRWRDLLLCYLEIISEGRDVINIPVAENEYIASEARPVVFPSRYSLLSVEPSNEGSNDEDFVDVEVDVDNEVWEYE